MTLGGRRSRRQSAEQEALCFKITEGEVDNTPIVSYSMILTSLKTIFIFFQGTLYTREGSGTICAVVNQHFYHCKNFVFTVLTAYSTVGKHLHIWYHSLPVYIIIIIMVYSFNILN